MADAPPGRIDSQALHFRTTPSHEQASCGRQTAATDDIEIAYVLGPIRSIPPRQPSSEGLMCLWSSLLSGRVAESVDLVTPLNPVYQSLVMRRRERLM